MVTVKDSKEAIVKRDRPSRLKLYLSVFAVYILHITTGCVLSFPSPVIPKLNLTKDEQSLISSLYSLGATPGPLVLAFGLDTIGRKGTLYVVWLLYMGSWAMLWSSEKIIIVYLGRLIAGLGFAGAFAGTSVYIAEIADNDSRGPLNSISQVFLAIGFLVEYCAGPYVSYEMLVFISFCVTASFGIVFFFAPESPYYLIAKGKKTEAFKVLKTLRGNLTDESINAEIKEIEDQFSRENESGTGLKKLMSPPVLKALAMSLFLIILQQGSGINAVLAYVQPIFQKANLSLDDTVVPMLVGLTNLVSSLPVPLLVGKFGVKIVLVTCGVAMGICLNLLGLYFYLLYGYYDVTSLEFLPVVSVILFNVFFCIGSGSLTWVVIADVFPSSVKGTATAICSSFSALFGFGVIEAFILLLNNWGFENTFVLFGCILLLGSLVQIIFVPNTSKMTFQDIEKYFDRKA
ncbi:unnamed protein product [Nezara viridula]|uniref:Major facilitator superfamily (MFS) profile domain-containing protein n=1 Tax=Nezara viridula TaxID=85310 RepID=A0A9P0MSI3_NEZVI|nr:unnamed protein product [Nezara viridula]